MTINTTIGKTYAVTSATECTITTPDGTLIATCQPGIQTCIIAPTTQIEISDPAALVTETFKGASAGSSAAGGATSLRQTLDAQLPHRDKDFCGFYLTIRHTSSIRTLTIHSMRERKQGGFPVWIKLFRLTGTGTHEFLALSKNKCERTQNGLYAWHFDPIPVSRNERIAVVSSGDYNKDKTDWEPEGQDLVWIDASIRTFPDGNDYIINPDGAAEEHALPEYSLTFMGESINGIPIASQDDLADHTSDKTSHITAAERTAWNNKADASALSPSRGNLPENPLARMDKATPPTSTG